MYPFEEIFSSIMNFQLGKNKYSWDFYRDWGKDREWFEAKYAEAILDFNVFNCLPVNHEVQSTLSLLKKMGYYIVLCTARGVGFAPDVADAAKKQTIDWLQHNKVEYDELIFSKDKSDANSFCFFDDNLENYKALERAPGCVSWLYTRPHNRDYHGRRVNEFRAIPGAVVWSAKYRRNSDNNGDGRQWPELLVKV